MYDCTGVHIRAAEGGYIVKYYKDPEPMAMTGTDLSDDGKERAISFALPSRFGSQEAAEAVFPNLDEAVSFIRRQLAVQRDALGGGAS